MTEAFLYIWIDKKTNKKYIGIHKGDINDGYVCSSKIVLEEYNKRPTDFYREILNFGTLQEMINAETFLLKQVNASCNSEYYNMHNGDGNFYNKGHSEETKKKLKIARNKRTDLPRLGKSLSIEGKLKASESAKKRLQTEEGKNNVSKAGKISVEKRANDENYKEQRRKDALILWENRRKGLVPYPKTMRESHVSH